jgi:hypothetical protein
MNIQTLLHITQITTPTATTKSTNNTKSTVKSTTTQNKMNNKSQVVTQQFVNDNETFSFQGKSFYYFFSLSKFGSCFIVIY